MWYLLIVDYCCIAALQGKAIANNMTDIDVVIVVLRDNYLKAENYTYKNKRPYMNLFYA